MKKKHPSPTDQKLKKAAAKNGANDVKPIPIVGVGASAGGLSAFKDFFSKMPAQTGMAFVLVQHLDPTHESLMVDLLSRHTKMKVIQVEDNMKVEANHVYMIPPNWDLAIKNGILHLTTPLQRRGMRMPIDYFFNTLAEDQREKAVCIILSGTGSDGTMGLKAVKSYGGMAMVQDPEEAQYDGMPTSAISTGVVDNILPAQQMSDVLINYIQHSYIKGQFGTEPLEISEPDDFNTILAIMHAQLGHNFQHYKKNTLIRRINRRMGLKQIELMHDYAAFLRKNPDETEELFKDCLIGVTGFFRESQSWKCLDDIAINAFVASKDRDQPIRIWVPGCSSGEEAYTLAILLNEKFASLNTLPRFSIFATDIDSNALEFARVGRYPESVASDIPEELLDKYFRKEDGFYQVSTKLRENLVFSAQNLISDPPFSKLDLITCRNLLIYLESQIQQKVVELFHFALNQNGYLMLGNSETIGRCEHLFEAISKKWRIYRKLKAPVPTRVNFPILPDKKPWRFTQVENMQDGTKQTVKPAEVIRDALLAKLAPVAVLITRKHQIIYHFGDTTQYLQFRPGEHTDDLFVLIREGLATRIRGAVHKAVKNNVPVSVTGARVKREGKYQKVRFDVTPLDNIKNGDGLYLVSFNDERPGATPRHDTEPDIDDENLVRQLEHELGSTREELQNTIEELETSNEELKASNEEIMSMNEELQSSNEELETSKEELQSLNEELNTVNNELQEKVRSLEDTNNDITNLVNSTNIAALFLDTQFNINFYTPPAKQLFNLIPTDIGRPLKHVTKRFNDSGMLDDAKDVLDTLKFSSEFIRTDTGEWYTRKIYPYRTQDSRIEGIVITFENVTELKTGLAELETAHKRLEHAQRMANLGHWDWYLEEEKLVWSKEVYRIFGQDPFTFELTAANFEKCIHPDDLQSFIEERRRALEKQKDVDIEHRIVLPDKQIRYVHEKAQISKDDERKTTQISGTVQDITERKQMQFALERSEAQQKAFLNNSAIIAWIKDDKGRHVFLSPNYEKQFNVKCEDWKGKTDHEVWPADIAKEFTKNDQIVFQSDEPLEVVEHTVDENGKISWWRNNKFNFTDAAGNKFIGGVGVDVTDLKNTEAELKLIYDSVETSPFGFDVVNEKAKFIYVNASYLKMWGYEDKNEILGTSPALHCIDPDLPEKIISTVNTKGNETFEFKAKRKDGSAFDVRMHVACFKGPDGLTQYHGCSEDITAIKEKELLSEKNRQLYEEVYRNCPVSVMITQPNGTILHANAQAANLLGYSEAELIDGGREQVVDTEDPRLDALLKERRKTGACSGQMRFIKKDGSKLETVVSSSIFITPDGEEQTILFIQKIDE